MLLSVVAHRPWVPARGCARVRTCVLRDCVCKWCITARNVHVRVDCDGGYECRYKRKQESDADSEGARKPAEGEEEKERMKARKRGRAGRGGEGEGEGEGERGGLPVVASDLSVLSDEPVKALLPAQRSQRHNVTPAHRHNSVRAHRRGQHTQHREASNCIAW